MTHASKLTLVQICGAGHSGSTLLGMILGSHSESAYLGEAKKAKYVGDPNKPMKKRVCKFCGADCPIWGDYVWDPDVLLYEEMGRRFGAHILVDSTKGLPWLRRMGERTDANGHRRVMLFLQRDGRAVINSRVRKYPDREVDVQIQQWLDQIVATNEVFDAYDGPKMVVQYERLSTDPEGTIREVCDLLEIDYQPEMLHFGNHEHHVLGGNNGTQFLAARERYETADAAFVSLGNRSRSYYESHGRGIRLDLRWKEELPSSVLTRFEELAADVNRPMAWNG